MTTPLVTKDRIRAGTMLLEDGTGTPESFILNIEPYSMGWSLIIDATAAQLGRDLESAGWTFFYLAGAIHVSSFGLNDQSRTDRAMARLIDTVKLQQFNCLEITQVRRVSFSDCPTRKSPRTPDTFKAVEYFVTHARALCPSRGCRQTT